MGRWLAGGGTGTKLGCVDGGLWFHAAAYCLCRVIKSGRQMGTTGRPRPRAGTRSTAPMRRSVAWLGAGLVAQLARARETLCGGDEPRRAHALSSPATAGAGRSARRLNAGPVARVNAGQPVVRCDALSTLWRRSLWRRCTVSTQLVGARLGLHVNLWNGGCRSIFHPLFAASLSSSPSPPQSRPP